MKTTTKPATPLDLAQFEGNLPLNWGEQSQLIAECKHLRAQNAELVAALRNFATGVPAHEDYYRAQALLAKLGEGKL